MKPKGPGAKLLGKTALYTGGNLLYMVGQFVFLTLLARLSDPLLVGAYGLANALLNPLFFMTKMGMRQAQAADASDTFNFATYKALRSRFLILATLISAVMIPLLPAQQGIWLVFVALVWAKLAEAGADLYYGYMLQRNAQHLIALSLALRAVACVLCFLGIHGLTHNPLIAVLGMPLGWSAVYVLFDLPRAGRLMARQADVQLPAQPVLPLLRHLWPLAIGGAIGQLQQSFPRLLVNQAFDTAVLGSIVPALQVHVMVVSLGSSVCQSLLPSVARALNNGNPKAALRQVRLTLAGLIPLLAAGAVICQLWGPQLVALVFGEGFENSGKFLGLLAVSWGLRVAANVVQNLVFGSGRFHSVLNISLTVTAVLVVASLVLWQWLGLLGIMGGLVIASATHLLIAIWQAHKALAGLRPPAAGP